MGALTSKTYSFKARSWENEKVLYYDFLNSTLSRIKIELNEHKHLVRIVPSYNHVSDETYITNKIRYIYDFVKNQRITKPLIFGKNNYSNISYNTVSKLIKLNLFKQNPTTIFLNKNFIDLRSAYSFLNLSKNQKFNIIYDTFDGINSNFKNFDFNFLKQQQNLNFVFVNINLRFESPLFLQKLKQFNQNNNNSIKCFSLGSKLNNLNFIKNLGSNVDLTLQKILYSKIKFKNFYSSYFQTKFFIPKKFSSLNLLSNFSKLPYFNSKFNNDFIFNLFETNGENSLTFYNFRNSLFFSNNNNNKGLLLNFNNDNLNFNYDNYKFKVYLGTNGILNNLKNYQLFLPSSNILEKTSYYRLNSKKVIVLKNVLSNNQVFDFDNYFSKYLNYQGGDFVQSKDSITYLNSFNNNVSLTKNPFFISNFLFYNQYKNKNYNYYLNNIYGYCSKNLNLAYKKNLNAKNELFL